MVRPAERKAVTLGSRLSELTELLKQCNTVADFANRAMEFFGNPMLIFDSNMNVLAGTRSAVSNEQYRAMLNSSELPEALTRMAKWRKDMKRLWKQTEAQVNVVDGEEHLSKVLMVNETVVGQIDVVGLSRSFTQEDLAIAELIAYPLAMKIYGLFHSTAQRKSERDYWLEYLLEGHHPDLGAVEFRAINADWKPGMWLYVLRSTPMEQGEGFKLGLYEAMLHSSDVILRFRDHVVVLLSRNRPLEEDDWEALEIQLQTVGQTCGASTAFHTLPELKQYYDQATAALDIGLRLLEERQLFRYEDYICYDMFRTCGEKTSLEQFILPGVRQLIEADRAQNLELMKTLRTYMYYGRSVQQTAELLHIHRNTVSYRIGKAFDILGFDMNDGRKSLQLSLSIQILEFLDAKNYFN